MEATYYACTALKHEDHGVAGHNFVDWAWDGDGGLAFPLPQVCLLVTHPSAIFAAAAAVAH